MKRTVILCLAVLCLTGMLAAPANAELNAVGAGGFTTSHTRQVGAPPEEAYRALVEDISKWWEASHTWSADAANLYVDASPGGCFCEKLPDGGWVEHLHIIYLDPGREIRLRGSLGPLMQMGIGGTMTWAVRPTVGGSEIAFTYVVHGYLEGGFEDIAPAVDGVIGAQIDKLATHLGSG